MRVSVGLVSALLVALGGCNSGKKDFVEAEKLAKQYCQSCHVFPSPSSLDKDTWLYSVLPAMGPRLGMRAGMGIMYKYNAPQGTLPDSAAMTQQEWDKIISYFYTTAPATLKRTHPTIEKSLPQFNYRATAFRAPKPPTTSLVKIDRASHAVYVCDGVEFKLRVFDQHLALSGEAPTNVAVSSISLDTVNNGVREATLLNMGILSPSDVTSGGFQTMKVSKDLKPTLVTSTAINKLMRPVYIENWDMDGDGRKDYLVCEFGNFYGDLMWLKNRSDNTIEKRILRNQPGAMQTRSIDYNHDGKEDILALMAQGDEGLYLYENKGNGNFDEKTLLRFSSVYGSTSFDLADFNGDGFLDIVYTAGDNSDFSKILKPYHGVYIFLNDGKWNFDKHEYFFPINGCFKVIANDFDQDGDTDLATISFFPDLKTTPEEGFVYLRNEGHLKFHAQTFPEVINGHWLTMDADDLDGDGDTDIVLGNMAIGPLNIQVENNWASGPSFILLENRLR